MQEAAYQHAEHLELGHSRLSERGLAWVLSRQRIEIIRFPQWGDTLEVQTWPSGSDRLFFYRDFEITDGHGEPVLQSATAWFIIDLEKRERAQPEWLDEVDIPVSPKVFDSKMGRLRECACEDGSSIPVSYGDLDMNGHVNNIRYIEWVLNHLPLDFHQSNHLKSLEMNYLSEAVYGHRVSVCEHEIEPGLFSHGVMAGGNELFRARSVWRPVS
jgi:acyl-ACP thioesterase